MKTDDFDFELPARFIAQHPASPRDAARLLVVGRRLENLGILDLPRLLRAGDLLVFNDTRVIPSRLFGHRLAGRRPNEAGKGPKVEVTLHKPVDETAWKAFARPARKLKPGDTIQFAAGFSALVAEKGDGGEVTLSFSTGGKDLSAALGRHGAMPLPPYIKRDKDRDARDRQDYQTLFAKRDGAVAAPTAGLHFTPRLMEALEARGVGHAFLTLHVGAGSFLPVRAEDVAGHQMHAEWGEISDQAADAVNRTRAAGGRIVAVGTTALRLMETAADEDGHLHPFRGETDIFITPGYAFRTARLLLTNFHLPRSTLFMLVSAFAGTQTMKGAYAHAMDAGYRFYSYGDACLLERGEAADR